MKLNVELEDGRQIRLTGRQAWALAQLKAAGEQGVTTLERPALRWSSYVHRLRQKGVAIDTEMTDHGGPFAGRHGRYRLRSAVRIDGGDA